MYQKNGGLRIAFCTTCKGRLQHLRETLAQNLTDNLDYDDSKFVVLSYGDLETNRYLLTVYEPEITIGKVVVYHYNTDGPFNLAHAKNIVARCGIFEGADVLVTQDADNFTGKGLASYIARKIKSRTFLCPNFPLIHSMPFGYPRPGRGYAGRLAILSEDFIKVGGYDEIFDTWRAEDIDLIARLLRMGWTMQHFDIHNLYNISHCSKVRFKEYPHAQELYENDEQPKLVNSRDETVVNFGKFGVGKVYRNFDCMPIELKPVPTRVFGIGMHKTGTTSLDSAFKILGLDSFHWGSGEAALIWREMNAAGRSKTMEQWYAFSDLPFPMLYKKLDQAYPGSKFILTVRSEDEWLKSVAGLWDPFRNPTRWEWDVYPVSNELHTALYGQREFNADVFLQRYQRHNEEVKEYFKHRPHDLLVIHSRWNSGWNDLCKFLGVPIPKVAFPFHNQTSENEKRVGKKTVPVKSTVAKKHTSESNLDKWADAWFDNVQKECQTWADAWMTQTYGGTNE